MLTFSVVLTSFNRQSLLDKAISSVLRQTCDDFELIVVDDGSSPPVVVPDDERIRLLRHPRNQGIAAARNAGIAAASGRYLTFLDDDDRYDEQRLEMVRRVVGRAPITLCWASYIGEPTRGRYLNGDVSAKVLTATTPHVGATTVERSIVQSFNTAYAACEDVEWWLRMSAVHLVQTVPQIGYWIRKHDGPRLHHGAEARIQASHRLLRDHAAYFSRHRRAAAFRWRRIGLLSRQLGRERDAAHALARSLLLAPAPQTLRHLIVTPGRIAVSLARTSSDRRGPRR